MKEFVVKEIAVGKDVQGEFVRLVVELPYSAAWSKNIMWRHSKGKTFLNEESKVLRDKLAAFIKLRRLPWRARKKTHIYIDVHRSDMRADVQNFIDLICDAVSAGTGVGDNYFAGAWEWEKVPKGQEKIILEILQ
jgi:Holliday junction resolvase RusA-like endonuclease